jgi:hypothetical protein
MTGGPAGCCAAPDLCVSEPAKAAIDANSMLLRFMIHPPSVVHGYSVSNVMSNSDHAG